MNWNDKTLNFLHLHQKEKDILRALSSAKSTQEASKQLPYPRTTVAFTIKNLMKRGLIYPLKHGKRLLYVSLTEKELLSKFNEASEQISVQSQNKKGARIKTTKGNEYSVHVGVDEILVAFEKITLLNKDERVKAIQSNASWKLQHKKLSIEGEVRFNNAIKNNKIIMEAIIESNAYKIFAETYKDDLAVLKELSKSFEGRMADYTAAPLGYFSHSAELFIFKSTILFINWEEEIAIEITNQDIFRFMCDLFTIAKNSGRKIDHNKEIRNILSLLENK